VRMVKDYFGELASSAVRGWDRFWFTPSDPATLCLIRVFAGAMLFYTHLVWALDLEAFFGTEGWLAADLIRPLREDYFAWSFLWWIESPTLLWNVHLAGLVVFAMLTIGLYTRVVSVLAFFITVAYVNRAAGSLFGLDQINALLAMYLMLGPAGAMYSVDRWRKSRGQQDPKPVEPSSWATIPIRLIQLHMCVIYLFAGLSKLQGPSWWNGEAMWLALGNLEYQSVDMTWLVQWPIVINLLTHITIFWEVSYCFLVWPRLLRPIMIGLAIPLHMGICLCLGMMTFGLIMLVGNMAFVSPWIIRRIMGDKDARPDAVEETSEPESSRKTTARKQGRTPRQSPRSAARASSQVANQ